MSEAHLGFQHSEESKALMSERRRGVPNTWSAELIRTTDFRKKLSEALLAFHADAKRSRRWRDANGATPRRLAALEKARVARTGQTLTPETRERISESVKAWFEKSDNLAKWIAARWDERRKREYAEQTKMLHADPEWRAEWLRRWQAVNQLAPNRLEVDVLAFLNEREPDAWRFNDGQTIIAGKIPDFIRTDGAPICVDAFGDYWHKGEDPQPRIDHFADHGYALVVVWESEFRRDPSILFSRLDEAFREELVA